MYRMIILPSAKTDITDSAKWYNKQQPGLGIKLIGEIRRKTNSIKQNPFAYSIRYENVRTANLDIFPFMIHFSINDKIILIFAILHTSLDPKKWIDRS